MSVSYPQQGTKDPTSEYFGSNVFIDDVNIDSPPPIIATVNTHYAIEIDVSDNTDIADEKEIGLFNDSLLNVGAGGSVFRWVTERPSYDGVTVIPLGELSTVNALKWAEGMITTKSSLGSPNRLINLNTAGSYGSLSDFQFLIDNVEVESGNFSGQKFFDILDDNNIFLLNRKIRFYVILDNLFFNVWSGVVSSLAQSELQFRISCEDDFKNIHKTLPPQIANEDLFPSILKKSIGKPIPVTMGQVDKGKLLNIQTRGEPIGLNIVSDQFGNVIEEKSIAVISKVTPNLDSEGVQIDTTLELVIGSKVIIANTLISKFLRVVFQGGSDEFFEITDNSASSKGDVTFQKNIVTLRINGLLDDTIITVVDPTKLNTSLPTKNFVDETEKWSWVEIFDFNNIYLISNQEISDFPDTENGQQAEISFFDKDVEEFVDISEAFDREDDSDIVSTGFPGISAFTNTESNGGIFSKQVAFEPQRVTSLGPIIGFGHSLVSNDFPASGSEIPNIVDKNRTTKNTLAINRNQGQPERYSSMDFQIQFPNDINLSAFDELYFIADYDITVELASAGPFPRSRNEVVPISIVPSFGGFINEGEILEGAFDALEKLTVRMIKPSYYNETGTTPNLLKSISKIIDLKEFYDSTQEFDAYPFIDVKIRFGNNADVFSVPAGEDITLDVFQIAIGGVKKISITNNDIFVKLNGEKFDFSNKTDSIFYIFRHILENYDGISAAQIELNNLSNRLIWTAGRQVIERKNSVEYLRELAEQSFTAMFPTRDGKRGFNTYREQSPSGIVFAHDTGTILKNSINRFELSPINEVYNEFDIKYDQNVANGRFDKSVFIKKVDESAFPARLDSTIPGDDTAFTAAAWTDLTISVASDGAASGTITGITSAAVADQSISLDDPGNFGFIEFGSVLTNVGTTITFSFNNKSGLLDGAVSTTGDIIVQGSNVQAWKNFAGGYGNYNRGKDLWDVCHNVFLETLVVRALPERFSLCKWYIDESNFDGDPGDQSTPHKYLELLVEWATRQKEITEFSIPLTSANLVLELATEHQFRDQKFTANQLRDGYITKIKIVPASDEIVLEMTLIPSNIESVTDCLIVESGLAADTIQETGSQPDEIQETGLC